MNNFELVTQLRDLMVGSGSSQSLLRRASVLGAFCSLLVLGACGKSASPLSPDGQNLGAAGARTGDGATSSAGQPSAKFAYSSSELALIKQTSATNGWVTVLSCPIKSPAASMSTRLNWRVGCVAKSARTSRPSRSSHRC